MRSVLVFVLLLAGILLTVLYLGQRKMLFPMPAEGLPDQLGSGVELIELPQGHALLALPASAGTPYPLIVFAHGNGEVAHWSLSMADYFRARGIAVLLLEYPGYAGSPGRPTALSITQSALMAVDQVVVRDDIDGDRLIAYGRSIGSGVATQLAVHRPTRALILESPFTSLRALAIAMGMPAFLLRDQFDNAQAMPKLKMPVFLYHGTQDRLIPISHSERLAELASDVQLLTAECGHNDCPRPWPQVIDFLVSNGVLGKTDG
ncbi:MAG: alpha/beta hydrolase [Gammaproteobacteria bacterium]|nr:alpha/beta hydrolase [Gammaproteobacteria bacterium]